MSILTTTQTKMLQDLLAIQQVYYAEFETLDILQDDSGKFFLVANESSQIESLQSRFGKYPVSLGTNFEEAKTTLIDIIST